MQSFLRSSAYILNLTLQYIRLWRIIDKEWIIAVISTQSVTTSMVKCDRQTDKRALISRNDDTAHLFYKV